MSPTTFETCRSKVLATEGSTWICIVSFSNSVNESIQLRTSLEVLMRSKLVLSMSNRERSLEKLNERIRSLRDRLDYEEANFDEELGRQMDQLMHQLDPVQAARGK